MRDADRLQPAGTIPAVTKTSKLTIAVSGAVVVLAAIVVTVLALRPAPATPRAQGSTPAAAPATSATPTPPAAQRQRVADLMAKASCKGDVIGTQLYSYETGRCTLDGAEVTIAVFDTNQLRDQWVNFGRGFGFTLVIGERWAAGVEKPDQATALATKLGGKMA